MGETKLSDVKSKRRVVRSPIDHWPGLIAMFFAFSIPLLVNLGPQWEDSSEACFFKKINSVHFLILKYNMPVNKACYAEDLLLLLILMRVVAVILFIKKYIGDYEILYRNNMKDAEIIYKRIKLFIGGGVPFLLLICLVQNTDVGYKRLLVCIFGGMSIGILFVLEGILISIIYLYLYCMYWYSKDDNNEFTK